MIRLKNKVLPVWFQFDGDEEQLNRAKQTIIEDIIHNGLNHYTTYVDIMDQPDDNDKGWDGTTPEETTVTLTPEEPGKGDIPTNKPTKKAKVNEGLPKGAPADVSKFTSESKTTKTATKTAS